MIFCVLVCIVGERTATERAERNTKTPNEPSRANRPPPPERGTETPPTERANQRGNPPLADLLNMGKVDGQPTKPPSRP